MAMHITVLIIEDRPEHDEQLQEVLLSAGFEPHIAYVQIEAEYVAALSDHPNLILADFATKGIGAKRALQLRKARDIRSPLIVIAERVGEEEAVTCLKLGAADFVLWEQIERLGPAVAEALQPAEDPSDELGFQFRALFEQSLVGIYMVVENRVKYINAVGAKMFGYQPHEIINRLAITDLIDPEDYSFVAERIQQRLAGPIEVSHLSFRGRHKNGSILYLEAAGQRILHGGDPAVLGIMVDVTARKLAENALRESRERFLAIIRNVPVVLFILDRNGAITFLEGRAMDGLLDGKSPESMIGQPVTELSQKSPLFLDLLDRVLAGESVTTVMDMGNYAYEICCSPLRDGDQAIAGMIGVAMNVTELRRAQSAEREQRVMAETLRETTALLTSTLDLDTVMNRILENVGQVVPHDAANIMLIQGDTARALYWRGWTAEHEAAFKAFDFPLTTMTLQQMITSRAPIFIADTSADTGWINPYGIYSYAAAPILVHDEVIGFLNLDSRQRNFYNATHAERLQAFADQAGIAIENAQLYAEIRRYAGDLENRITERMLELTIANEKLQELDRLKSKFMADVTHEVRTPLSNLNLRLYLLEHDTVDKTPEHLMMLNKQIAQLNELLESILTFSRMEEERQSQEALVAADLNSIVSEVVTAQTARAQAAGLSLGFEANDLPSIQAQTTLLARAITNLVANAINYTPAGMIAVRTYREKNQVCVGVSDTGTGISPQDIPHLFERFYRGSRVGSSNIPGAGLGLAIAKEIVELHKGTIDVSSQIGHGSTFTIRLPLT